MSVIIFFSALCTNSYFYSVILRKNLNAKKNNKITDVFYFLGI